jgi:formylglycine-generating enzyme required for sulfatase activity
MKVLAMSSLRSVAGGFLIVKLLTGCQRSADPETVETPPTIEQKSPPPMPVRTAPSADAEMRPIPPAVRPVTSAQPPAPVTSTAHSIDVPAGSTKIHGETIEVDAFAIDRTEVTVGAYARCVAEKKCSPPSQYYDACNWSKRTAKADHPINCVTVMQAKKYCEQNGQALPTVAEWQLAAGGPEGRNYPWGAAHPSNVGVLEIAVGQDYAPGPARHNLCWIGDGTAPDEKYPTGTCKVGSFPAGNTPSGIADLAGNVGEWTGNPQKQPHGPILYSIKGGGYDFNPMGRLEVAVEDEVLHDSKVYLADIGFRCATPKPAPRP